MLADMVPIGAEVSYIEIGVSDASKSRAFLEQMFGWKFHPLRPRVNATKMCVISILSVLPLRPRTARHGSVWDPHFLLQTSVSALSAPGSPFRWANLEVSMAAALGPNQQGPCRRSSNPGAYAL